MLTLIDEFTRECLAVEVGVSMRGEKVRSVLTELSNRGISDIFIACVD